MARRPVASESHDPSRREFFRTFSRQTIHNAGAVVGAASELQRTSLAAAREMLDAAPRPAPAAADAEVPPPDFRSAYRYTGDAVVLLDQRNLPERVTTFEAREPNEVAAAIRGGAVTPGPVLGELAAYAVALAARAAADRSDTSREQVIRAAAGTLRASRREVRAVAAALERVEARYDSLANEAATGAEVARALADEADAICGDATLAQAAIGRSAAELLASAATDRPADASLELLVHGDAGPLTGGMVGMGTACFRALLDAGHKLHVWVTAAAPTGEGSRVTAYQLAQLDVPHTVVPDAAVGALLAARRIDAVVLRADTVAANGDVIALLGARQAAQLAADAGVRVVILQPRSAVDPGLGDAARLAPPAAIPQFDVVPAALISARVGESEA